MSNERERMDAAIVDIIIRHTEDILAGLPDMPMQAILLGLGIASDLLGGSSAPSEPSISGFAIGFDAAVRFAVRHPEIIPWLNQQLEIGRRKGSDSQGRIGREPVSESVEPFFFRLLAHFEMTPDEVQP